MSHIAFDLDALPLVPKVARSAGIQEAVVGWGLTQMWEWCWREKTDRVTTNHLRGFFGAELGAVLVDFGFLEAVGSSLWRVRGSARYLRISQAQSEAGKRSKGNLKQYRKPAGEPGDSVRLTSGLPPAPSRLEPEDTRSERTGSTATSDERLATSDKRQAGARPADWELIVADFATAGLGKYRPDRDKDPTAFKALLADAPLEEIRTRWRRGLANAKANRFPRVTSLAELRQHWNRLAVDDSPDKPREPTQYAEGRVRL